jgi:hypothetical protein
MVVSPPLISFMVSTILQRPRRPSLEASKHGFAAWFGTARKLAGLIDIDGLARCDRRCDARRAVRVAMLLAATALSSPALVISASAQRQPTGSGVGSATIAQLRATFSAVAARKSRLLFVYYGLAAFDEIPHLLSVAPEANDGVAFVRRQERLGRWNCSNDF